MNCTPPSLFGNTASQSSSDKVGGLDPFTAAIRGFPTAPPPPDYTPEGFFIERDPRNWSATSHYQTILSNVAHRGVSAEELRLADIKAGKTDPSHDTPAAIVPSVSSNTVGGGGLFGPKPRIEQPAKPENTPPTATGGLFGVFGAPGTSIHPASSSGLGGDSSKPVGLFGALSSTVSCGGVAGAIKGGLFGGGLQTTSIESQFASPQFQLRCEYFPTPDIEPPSGQPPQGSGLFGPAVTQQSTAAPPAFGLFAPANPSVAVTSSTTMPPNPAPASGSIFGVFGRPSAQLVSTPTTHPFGQLPPPVASRNPFSFGLNAPSHFASGPQQSSSGTANAGTSTQLADNSTLAASTNPAPATNSQPFGAYKSNANSGQSGVPEESADL